MVAVSFTVSVETYPGQNVVVVGSDASLGGWDATKGLRLGYEGGQWKGKADIKSAQFEYKYVIEAHGGHSYEFGDNRKMDLGARKSADIRDSWRPFGQDQNALYTSFFLDGVSKALAIVRLSRPALHTGLSAFGRLPAPRAG
jgi:hypothetical protein